MPPACLVLLAGYLFIGVGLAVLGTQILRTAGAKDWRAIAIVAVITVFAWPLLFLDWRPHDG